MTRNLKALGLALVAVFAMSAMAAQAASAAHTFTSPESGGAVTTIKGEGENHIFSAAGAEIKCAKATFNGTQAAGAPETITVTPTYDGPCFLNKTEVTVTNVADCTYVFGGTTNASGDAPVRLDCSHHTKGIEIVGPGCTLWIGDTHNDSSETVNQELTGVSYTNTGTVADGNKRDVDVKATVTGIKYESSGFVCELLEIPATGSDGVYTGNATVKGFVGGNQVGILVDGASTDDL